MRTLKGRMMSIQIRQGGDSSPTMINKAGSSPCLTPLDVQMPGSSCYVEWFTVCTMHSTGKRLQSPPLGAVAPPNGKAQTGDRRPSVYQSSDWNALNLEQA